MGRVWQVIERGWLMQRGSLFPWVPVLLACGIGVYFSLRIEPATDVLWACGGASALLALAAWYGRDWAGPILWALALLLAGFALAGLRTHLVAGPVLGWRYYGPVEGRIVAIDRSASDAVRLTLDRVVLSGVDPDRVPDRVRVSLHASTEVIAPRPGLRVMTTAHLLPPSGPAEPGGFDFRRHAWFQGIGAVGYSRVPLLTIAQAEGWQAMFRARMALSDHVQTRLPGEEGAFAAAIMAGDRSGMDQQTLEVLRTTNLAHLLAISGLHMGLLVGFVFSAFRLILAAVPPLGLRLPAKKFSAALALVVAAGYLGLSGGNVATERAFVMAAVVLVAVMLDRRAISLRSVALAATILLVWQPEALLGPGFQMSFAATTALVAIYGLIRDAKLPMGPRWLRPISAVVITSVVAGLATAPLAAAHFNLWSHYGLVANLPSVPLMGLLVMPAAVMGAVAMPFGLDALPFWLMGRGLAAILWVAHWVAGLEGARGTVPTPGPMVLPMMALGALFMVLWKGWARLAGLLPVALSLGLWLQAARPDVLIADDGALVGVMTDAGRALNKAQGGGFIAGIWLENDGDATIQEDAALRWDARPADAIPVRALGGKRAAEGLTECATGEWVVLNTAPPEGRVASLPCTVVTPASLRKTGAIALYRTETGVRTVTARDLTGIRAWSPQ
ncbi:ComEC/Rec2 family competence protein [Roseovarius sp. D22-M7]|uniref:ComEC/Rec2 family competence protein n=1 Tax=Roseovarius sp. D22-M7 TaxID=3127116 RepID=UPI00300F8AE8